MTRRRHLIVGSGPGALSALTTLRSLAPDDEIKMVTMENHPPYSPTALPYVLAGRVQEDTLTTRGAAFFARQGCTFEQGREVVRVRPAAKQVAYRDGSADQFDTLLLATGAEPVRPPIPGLDEVGFLGFRTIADHRRLQKQLIGRREVAVLGGGLIGMEVAAALLEAGHGVQIVEKEPRLLPLYFDAGVESSIREVFVSHGARVHTATEVRRVERRGDKVYLSTTGGEISADVLVTSVGVRARTSIAAESEIAVGRGIHVDAGMRTSKPDIYAIGDVAEGPAFFGDQLGLNPIVPTAVEQGWVAANNMAGVPAEHEGWISTNVFNFFGQVAFSAGLALSSDPAHTIVTQTDEPTRQVRRLVLDDDRLVGAMFLNVPVDPGVILYLMRNRLEVGSLVELLLAKPRETGRVLVGEAERRGTIVAEESQRASMERG